MIACIAITRSQQDDTGDEEVDFDVDYEVGLFESQSFFDHWLRFNPPPAETKFVVVSTESPTTFMQHAWREEGKPVT